jgi:aspartate racemase
VQKFMKTIGLVGGISWVSTMDYYRFINEAINEKLGGLNFAECIIYSLNFADVQEKTWEDVYNLLLNACKSLEKSGADGIALCANTAHLYAEKLQAEIDLPFIHIGTATAIAVTKKGIKKIGLIGTKFTMELDFYRDKLEEYGLEVITPNTQELRDYIQHTIKEELGRGIINPETKTNYLKMVKDIVAQGAEGIILGCTEIPMLLSQEDFNFPVFDTTKIHSQAIIDFMLSKN